MPYLNFKSGGTGRVNWTPNTVVMVNGGGDGFIEVTIQELATLLGNIPNPNQPPLIDAGANQNITTNSVILSATASDPDGIITSYAWTMVSGPQEPCGVGFNGGSFTPLRTFTVTPSGAGDLVVNASDYLPGDLIILDGNFRSVTLNDVQGEQGNPIVFRNPSGVTTTIGNPNWAANGGPTYAIAANNSRHFVFAGTHWNNFIVAGSTINTIPSGESEPYRSAYRNMSFDQFTENFEICYMTVQDGGNGAVAKTEPVSGQSATWYPNRELGQMLFHDLIIEDCYNEALYIGHTATYWDLAGNQPYNPSPYDPPPANTNNYKQPIMINGVKVYNTIIRNVGKDGVQISACKNVEVYQNNITNWASIDVPERINHNGGILIGGRCENSNTHDNITRESWGEHFQFYATGPNHLFNNNLCYNTDATSAQADGAIISIAGRAGTNNTEYHPAQITLTSNTISRTSPTGNLIRVNGYFNKQGSPVGADSIQAVLNKNIIMAPKNNNPGDNYDSYYVYTENPLDVNYEIIAIKGSGANVNVQYGTVAAANVDTNNYYLPNSGSVTQGFRKIVSDGPQELIACSQIISPSSATTQVTGLISGVYVYKCTVTDNNGASANDNTQVTVNL